MQADPEILFALPILVALSVCLGFFLTERAWGQCMMMTGIIVVISEIFKHVA